MHFCMFFFWVYLLMSFLCKQVLPQFVFNSRDPIVMGVMVEAGIVKEGTPICVPSQEVSIIIIRLHWYVDRQGIQIKNLFSQSVR